jgi:catechol 2,3-dioxygenase-like lactoylglutathione lyase family enzyme
VGDPYRLAQALTGAAEAAAADGDRLAAAAHVRGAAEIADRLSARLLREQAELLARRARLPLAGDPAAPAADPGEQARYQYGLTARELASGFESHHCGFLTSEAEFDAAFARIRSAGITYYADPHHERPGEINNLWGGRGVYFDDPDGHNMEIITQPYGEAPAS